MKQGQVTENESERGWAVRAAESGLDESMAELRPRRHVQGMTEASRSGGGVGVVVLDTSAWLRSRVFLHSPSLSLFSFFRFFNVFLIRG